MRNSIRGWRRWTREAAACHQDGKEAEAEAKLDRCIEVLGYMDRGIDMSRSYDIAVAILSLHRFAIATLVKAKGERAIGRPRAAGENLPLARRNFCCHSRQPFKRQHLTIFPNSTHTRAESKRCARLTSSYIQ